VIPPTELHRFQLRAAPGGGLFGCWWTTDGSLPIQTIAVNRHVLRLKYLDNAGHVVPGADGKTIYTAWLGRRTADGQALDPETRQTRSEEILIPSASPIYYASGSRLSERCDCFKS